MLAELWDWIKTIAITFIVVFLFQHFLFSPAVVNGNSMQPTLENKQWLLSNKIVYYLSEPKVGDVVVMNNPNVNNEPDNKYFVKRVVGAGGDHLQIRDGALYRNDVYVEESYTSSMIEGNEVIDIVVPEGYYYVMGDNRRLMMSHDSRSFGAVAKDEILGRIDGIIWPISKFKWF